jgi:hypothetical protein
VWLIAPGRIFGRSWLAPHFHGFLVGLNGRTRIVGRFQLHPLVVGLAVGWSLGAVLLGIGVVQSALFPDSSLLTRIVVPCVALAAGLGMSVAVLARGARQAERLAVFMEVMFETASSGTRV